MIHGFAIPAEVHTDDHVFQVKFDAVEWFNLSVFGPAFPTRET